MGRFHRIFSLVTFFAFVFQAAFAYGCLPTLNYAKAKVGEMITFEILFWSDNVEKINFYADNNENFAVNILPNPLYLNRYRKDGEILIGGRLYNVTKVRVFVVPKSEGNFNVSVYARKEVPAKDITFVEERVFRFFVEAEGSGEKANITGKVLQPIIFSEKLKERRNKSEFVFILLAILIVLISFLVYKHS